MRLYGYTTRLPVAATFRLRRKLAGRNISKTRYRVTAQPPHDVFDVTDSRRLFVVINTRRQRTQTKYHTE